MSWKRHRPEEIVAKAAPSGRAGLARAERGGRDPRHRRHRGGFRDELLDGEVFYTLKEAQIVIKNWRRHFNTVRPHAPLGSRPPASEVFVPAVAAWPAAPTRPARPATLPAVQSPTQRQTWTTQRRPNTSRLEVELWPG